MHKHTQTQTHIQCKHVHSSTWEAAKHGVSVVSSVEHLQRVPVLLCDKADYLNLRQERDRQKSGDERRRQLVDTGGEKMEGEKQQRGNRKEDGV